uniref:Uncharacterized protein n=1 Tax=Meloidogyne floridensis TaxID=298350 RepID=A0A915PDB7_9BILA
MGRRPKNKKRVDKAKKSYPIYIEKLKLFVKKERAENNCNEKIDKDLNPSEEVQKQLVEYYENTNEQYAKALNLINNKSKYNIQILDRTKDSQLNIEYIRGIIALYKYGEKLHKEAVKENKEDYSSSEESLEVGSNEEIKLQTLEEHNNNPLNFQPIQEEEDDYWIKWNLATMEEDDKLKKD